MSASDVQSLALSAADVAAILSVSTRQIWAWHAAGTLGPVPIKLSERMSRWDRVEVESWWAACREAGRPIRRSEWKALKNGGTS